MAANRDLSPLPQTVIVPRDQAREELARQVAVAYQASLKRLVQNVLNVRIRRKEGTTAVVQEALASFFGAVPDIRDSGGIWPLLAAITRKKSLGKARTYTAQRRDVYRERQASALAGEQSCFEFWERFGRSQPTRQEAVLLIDTVESLPEQQGRLLKMLLQGRSKEEMAVDLHCSPRTIERRVKELQELLERQLLE